MFGCALCGYRIRTAFLFGKSIRKKALALIEIAHPAFRQALLDDARKLGYVRKGQDLNAKPTAAWNVATRLKKSGASA